MTIENSLFSNAKFTIKDSDEKRMLKASNDLSAHLSECRPYYSMLARLSATTAMICVLFVISAILWWSQRLKSGKTFEISMSIDEFMFSFVPCVLLVGVVLRYVDRVWDWLFPSIWFSIGRQKQENDKRAKVRTWVLGGFATFAFGIVFRFAGILISGISK